MFKIAVSTLRLRWASFVGSLLALALGVGLMATALLAIAATGSLPERSQYRFDAAPVLVLPDVSVRFTDSSGEPQVQPLDHQPGLPAEVLRAVAGTGRAVADRTFFAQLADGPGTQVGHGWSAAEFGGYRLTAGRPPLAAGEVVVGGGDPAAVGRRVRLLTAAGPQEATVSGVTGPVPFEHALFFTDAEAERLAPDVTAIVATAPAERVREALTGAPAKVLTGPDRRLGDPNRDADLGRLDNVLTPLGVAAGVAAFVSAFMVAGTFAFSVAQRRRELALLRLIGASRADTARLVRHEAMLVGALGSAAGCLLGLGAAPPTGRWLVDHGLVPADFTVPPNGWALLGAVLIGLLTATAGVVGAATRAARLGPMDALRQTEQEGTSRAAAVLRWSVGALALLGGVAVMAGIALRAPQFAASAGGSAALALWTGGAFVVLAGVLVAPVVRLLTAVPSALHARFSRRPGMVWRTARAAATGSGRRTVATATPAVIIVALAGCLFGSVDTINAARVAQAHQRLAGTDFVVTPTGVPGLSRAVVDRLRAVPGATVLAETPTTLYAVEDGAIVLGRTVMTADPAALRAVARLPLTSGSLDDLGPGAVVLSAEWPGSPKAGQSVPVWLADGTETRLRVAAVFASAQDEVQGYLPAVDTGRPALASAAYVRLAEGADRAAAGAALRAAVAGLGVRVGTPAEVADAARDANEQGSRLGLEMILGCSLLYTAVSLGNTQVMAVAGRRRELALLRLTGATRGQVLRMLAAEALMCVTGGVALGAVAALVSTTGACAALRRVVGPLTPAVPWRSVAELGLLCAVVALAATLVPAALALRGGSASLTAARR
ncbi:ABC transporter permease [Kitasatospora sp. NPDC097643]|uniref:ABC transporter permease n=1 Tax=Kitasatospora sp. NPDC097643 TaxID=3157230 RepID=UPI003318419B